MTTVYETDKVKGEDIFKSETQDEINKALLYKVAKLLNREIQTP